MSKKFWWYIGGGSILLAALIVWRVNSRAEKIEYRFDKVDRGDVAVMISATGTLNADTTVQVGTQVSGTIAKLYADFNSRVKKGQLLAQLDPTFLKASVNEARANVDRARAQTNDAQRTMTRTSELLAKALISQADFDNATTALESAQATLKQTQAALDRAEVNLKFATITAPISGVVISRNVDVGQTVAASLAAPTLFTIANDLRKMQVQANVDEADIGSVKTGQDVSFRVDSYPDREFHGVVFQVRLAPVVTQNVVTYSVIIDVNNPDQKLMPGMTATVSINVETHENVLRVPIQATRFSPPDSPRETVTRLSREGVQGTDSIGRGGGRERGVPDPEQKSRAARRWMNKGRVWVMENDKPKSVTVTRGLQNTKYVEIIESGLKEGDEVIVGATGIAKPTTGSQQQNPFQPQTGGRRGGL